MDDKKVIKNESYVMGIDIGSTTVKVAVLDENKNIVYSDYNRHCADIQNSLFEIISQAKKKMGNISLFPVITGSGGLALAKYLNISFVQEVVAVSTAIRKLIPQTDVAIELGGEDAKIIYFEGANVEQRMNGICAGGTGSFIDQMASLVQTDATGLNEYAKKYKSIYPIAARCGVFAKSDIQPLINEGASKPDLSASIFQAVVNQTISGLACGKPIGGHVAFLGGPLHFLSELRETFIRTLHLDEEHTIFPENSHLFAAIGSALNSKFENMVELDSILETLGNPIEIEFEVDRMETLFNSEEEYELFRKRQAENQVKRVPLESYSGNCYLGIDAGSTTTKVALIGEDGSLLYSFYQNNNGNPLRTTQKALKEIYSIMPESAEIVYSCSTGYGEALLKAGLMLDEGEVETVSHYYAASFFDPKVDCILDIGGQDMKCIRIKNQTIENVQLNEACSSGCGSFIETFAKSLGYEVENFAKIALFAKNPINLGTRCTVFMNSKVKQAQKEGAKVEDISAGLAYSVIKNALYKVIKISDAKELGEHIVVQGGTFYNDAVLRGFEKIAHCEAIRPDIAGVMGAFGAALIAKERYSPEKKTTILSAENIENLKVETSMRICKGCSNACHLTVSKFDGNRKFITGNRCEVGAGKEKTNKDLPNLYKFKYDRIFGYEPLGDDACERGEVGIPRVLNMFENYPFWFTFFTKLKYKVVLSPQSSRTIYEMGIDSIPSESECYPAKLAHGHITWLIKQGVKFIFYPCVPYERKEFKESQNHYNCPIVTSYPENIKNNVDAIKQNDVDFKCPFLVFTSEKVLKERLIDEFSFIPKKEVAEACELAWAELTNVRKDIMRKGEETLEYIEKTGGHGIVLAGRPYHIEPEINHGIPELINSYGMAVLSEDSISHLAKIDRPLRINDQWMFQTRLYGAASLIKQRDDLDIIQLNSFGCGLDAVNTDQVNEILSGSNKLYTCLKIDEVNNLGAARIRIRSLLAAIRVRKKRDIRHKKAEQDLGRAIFTKEMKKDYTIIATAMSPIHFDIIESAFKSCGYKLELLKDVNNKESIDCGLKYVNNDACYPSLIVVGQIMHALLSGKYDLNKVAIFMTQTGGGCRASNYIGFIRRALKLAGMSHIPVISINLSKLESNPGFKINFKLARRLVYGAVLGDILQRCVYKMRPYEIHEGEVDKIHNKFNEICSSFMAQKFVHHGQFKRLCKKMIKEFDAIEINNISKPKVAIVGEILVKYMPLANNDLIKLLEKEGAEVSVPDFIDFFCYSFYNGIFKNKYLGFPNKNRRMSKLGIWFVHWIQKAARKAFVKSKHFEPSRSIYEIAELAESVVSTGNQTGEGWFLTGEMLGQIKSGVANIVCAQPFGCLPNHIVGKGVIKEIRRQYPMANITAIDYDPGASEVNQLNRIKLMLSTANDNMENCAK